MKTFIRITKNDDGTEVEIDSGSMLYRGQFAGLLPADYEKLSRALIFVAQNCHAHNFNTEVLDRRTLPKVEVPLPVESSDQESDSQGSETLNPETKKEGDSSEQDSQKSKE